MGVGTCKEHSRCGNIWFMQKSNADYAIIRAWKTTAKNLRRLYAETGEPMLYILDRLISEELKKTESEMIQTTDEAERSLQIVNEDE